MADSNKTIKIKVENNFKETKEDLEDLNEGLDETAEASEEASESTAKMSGNLAGMNPVIGGVAGAFVKLKKGLSTVGKSFFTLRGAIIASGIGALVLVIVSVTQAFKGSEEGQNKFSKLMYGMGVIMDNILDILADVGEMLISVFENPIESLKNFGKAIVDNILTRFEGILEFIPAIGSAISEVFAGNFSKAGKIATNALGKIVLGVEDVTSSFGKATSALSNFFATQTKEFKEGQKIADQRAKADILERELLVKRAKLQTEISKLKLRSREEETVSAEGRKKALVEAQALEDSLLQKELKVARLRFEAIKKENTLARSTKEAKLAEAQAEADLFNIISRRTDAQRATQRELNRVNKEILAQTKARRKVEKDALEFGVKFTKEMTNEEIQILTESAKTKYKNEEIARKKRIAQQNAQDKLSIEVMQEGVDKEIAKLVAGYDAKFLVAEGNAELTKQLEQKLEDDIIAIKKKSADKESDITKKKIAKQISDEKKLQAQKVQMASDGFGALADLVSSFEAKDKESAKRQFKVNKALQLGQAITGTSVGIINAYANPADVASGVAFAKSAIIGATGLANVVKIASTKFDSGTTGGLDTATQPSTPSGSSAPNINVVGNSGINQIAQLQQQPTQAFVVSSSVTSMQALDRNREQNATL